MKTERVAAALAGALCCAIGLIAACSLNLPNPTDPVPPTTTTQPPAPTTTIPPWQQGVELGSYRVVDISGIAYACFSVRQFPSYSPVDPKFGEEKPRRVWIKGSTNQVLNVPTASDAIGWVSTIPISELPIPFWYCFEGKSGVSVYYVPDSSRDIYPIKPVLEVKPTP